MEAGDNCSGQLLWPWCNDRDHCLCHDRVNLFLGFFLLSLSIIFSGAGAAVSSRVLTP